MEIWKDVPGYVGFYKVSNYGRVQSVMRNEVCGKISRKRRERILKPSLRKRYYFVSLSKYGKKFNGVIHRLVAAAFIPNPDNLPEIDHIDGNRANNYADNLRWVAAKQNSNNKNAPNTYKGKKINKGGKSVLQYDLDGNFIKEWVSTMEIQRKLNYHRGNISNCCNGIVKTAYNYIWRYKNDEFNG